MILKRCLKVATLQGGVDLKGGWTFRLSPPILRYLRVRSYPGNRFIQNPECGTRMFSEGGTNIFFFSDGLADELFNF